MKLSPSAELTHTITGAYINPYVNFLYKAFYAGHLIGQIRTVDNIINNLSISRDE